MSTWTTELVTLLCGWTLFLHKLLFNNNIVWIYMYMYNIIALHKSINVVTVLGSVHVRRTSHYLQMAIMSCTIITTSPVPILHSPDPGSKM